MADSLSSIAEELLPVTIGPPRYDGQLRHQVTTIGDNLRRQALQRVQRMREMSELLKQLADSFEAVDHVRQLRGGWRT